MEEYCDSLIDYAKTFQIDSNQFIQLSFRGLLSLSPLDSWSATVQQTGKLSFLSPEDWGLSLRLSIHLDYLKRAFAQYLIWMRLNMLIRTKRKWSWRYQCSRTSWFLLSAEQRPYVFRGDALGAEQPLLSEWPKAAIQLILIMESAKPFLGHQVALCTVVVWPAQSRPSKPVSELTIYWNKWEWKISKTHNTALM